VELAVAVAVAPEFVCVAVTTALGTRRIRDIWKIRSFIARKFLLFSSIIGK
jgi:hypothetical protein